MIHPALLLCILSFSSSRMIVQAPQSLSDYFTRKYPNGQIPYSIANYGLVPYGKTISGEMGTPSVLQDCVLQDLQETGANKPVLLVQRNDCSFTQKSINVQREGGKLAVIMDNREEDPGSVVMVDDGRGMQVGIATVLISEQDGKMILEALRKEQVVVSVSFEVVVSSQVELQLWTDITEHGNFVFLRNFMPYYSRIKEHVQLSVAYPTRKCQNDRCHATDCFYNLSYCRTDFKCWGVENKGQAIIKEQLRQYYIFEGYADKWWDYMLAYDQLCDDLAIVGDCSEKIMKSLDIDCPSICEKVQASFGDEDNQILREFSELKYNNSIIYYPSVVVNSLVYRGSLEPFQVYDLICASLTPKPQGCEGYVTAQTKSISGWVTAVVLVVILFGVFLFVCFRRMARRQIAEKINNQVNELVNQYITMYENERFEGAATQLAARKSGQQKPQS